jgi:D-3-phosphoglycerate dehydrogenase
MKTGFIGDLGTKCSQCGLNIVVFHLGRSDVGGEAVLLVGIDDALSA